MEGDWSKVKWGRRSVMITRCADGTAVSSMRLAAAFYETAVINHISEEVELTWRDTSLENCLRAHGRAVIEHGGRATGWRRFWWWMMGR